ncbi:T6SS phospholipase effector Tle1-like catalytic domain-containing protein [Paraburkholderia caribensis]|uniref:T6SS phospholipase effector Tle1-like catalytic domain-containing protein n=1 Tax=Paraburkholderia caribensis TaxID=75105 RepID=UPI001D079AB3|nr:DUF2235 domain-containing protein [Paraburkholderia caribensis]
MAGEKEVLQAAQSANRDVPTGLAGPKQDCSDVVNISVFFDGTGNNKDADENKKKWANPARMHLATQMYSTRGKNIHAIYVSGVGTPFNGRATDWLDQAEITLQDNVGGGVAGAGGTRRTDFGKNNVNDALRSVLLDNAKKLNSTTKAYAEKGRNESLGDLSKALAEHRLIKIINLSIFGFSRGAALARAFSNDILKECKTDKSGQLTYQGLPIRLHFMGLFDTVASVGGPAVNMYSYFSEQSLRVPGAVERCVHYVAAHELRFSFPSDLIRQGGKLMPGWTEVVYPGVHSDVGGGYEPIDQGRSNNYARIPMRDMIAEAVKSGVRIRAYEEMENDPQIKALFDERFKVESETESAYNRYRSAVPTSGSIEQQVDAHMKALYSAYGTMSRRGARTPDNQTDLIPKLIGHKSMAREVQELRSHHPSAAPVAVQFLGTVYGQLVKPDAWRLNAWDTNASDDVVALISNYVHDSKAGFLYGVEPFSYFRPRGISESSRNVMAAGLQWLDENLEAAKDSVIKVYATTQGIVVETWKSGVKTASATYKIGEQVVVDTIDAGQKYAVEVYQTSRNVVVSKIDEGERVIINSVDTVQKNMSAALDAARQKAISLAKQAQKAAATAADTVGKTVDDGVQAIEHGWQTTKTSLGM